MATFQLRSAPWIRSSLRRYSYQERYGLLVRPAISNHQPESLEIFKRVQGEIRREQRLVVEEIDNEVEADDDEDWTTKIRDGLDDLGIELPRYTPGTYRLLCPECDGGSTNELSLSVTIDEVQRCALYNCFRAKCGWSGIVRSSNSTTKLFPAVEPQGTGFTEINPNLSPIDQECYDFFHSRGIPKQVVDRNGIKMKITNGEKFIAFPYKIDGKIVNVKFRAIAQKQFHQTTGGANVFYGLDDLNEHTKNGDTGGTDSGILKEVIIVEGEMDKLALEAAGVFNVLSVPNGAPAKVKEGMPIFEDKKYSYLIGCEQLFERAEKIILATDNDASGNALAEELARRIGVWKCWRVHWPKTFNDAIISADDKLKDVDESQIRDSARWQRKDANEVLIKDDAEVLKAYVSNCQPFPVNGLHQFVTDARFLDFFEEVQNYYLLKNLCSSGYSTGWTGLDQFYKVVPGELTVVSGVPNSGKSEWLDAIAVQMAELYGWKIVFASMEKYAWDHARMLIEKHVRKPFFENVHYAKGCTKMTPEELQDGLFWINSMFPIILQHNSRLMQIDWILEKARVAVYRYGIRGLVIDPYNELDHNRPSTTTETEFVSEMLSKIKRFAQTYKVHVWLVAHPRQLHDWRGEAPNLYDISGSAHFINKADAGIVIHRNWDNISRKRSVSSNDMRNELTEEDGENTVGEDDEYLVRILVRKMRNKAAGRIGQHVLKYNPVDGTYIDPANAQPNRLLRR